MDTDINFAKWWQDNCDTFNHLDIFGVAEKAWNASMKSNQDSIRLDWIQKSARCDPKMDGQHVWWPTTFNNRLIGSTIRDAIDNDMEKRHE